MGDGRDGERGSPGHADGLGAGERREPAGEDQLRDAEHDLEGAAGEGHAPEPGRRLSGQPEHAEHHPRQGVRADGRDRDGRGAAGPSLLAPGDRVEGPGRDGRPVPRPAGAELHVPAQQPDPPARHEGGWTGARVAGARVRPAKLEHGGGPADDPDRGAGPGDGAGAPGSELLHRDHEPGAGHERSGAAADEPATDRGSDGAASVRLRGAA